MTLVKAVVKLGKMAAAKPGVLFVAMTRCRHPDHVMLEDDFPLFSDLRKQLFNPSFAKRIAWEKRKRAAFARTVREHMRDPTLFSEANCWTEEDAMVADQLVSFCRGRCGVALDDVPDAFVHQGSSYSAEKVASMWTRPAKLSS